MNISLSQYQSTYRPFLEEMLYEAVYWRRGPSTPSFKEALELPDIKKDIADIGNREGDIAVIATMNNSIPAGVAWMRCWNEEDDIRGYIAPNIPVLAIGVKEEYRQQGIGSKLIDWLIQYAEKQSIEIISLCVSKDNRALNLYRKKGFIEDSDLGHSFNMIRRISE